MKIALLFLLIFNPLYLFSHSLIIDIEDNKDGTIRVFGEFDTQESAAGVMMKILALHSGEVLYQQRLVDEGLLVQIPKIPYKIVLDDGDKHSAESLGIAPIGGFEEIDKKTLENKKEKKESKSRSLIKVSDSMAVNVSIILAFILILASIMVSIINTRKILKKMEELK